MSNKLIESKIWEIIQQSLFENYFEDENEYDGGHFDDLEFSTTAKDTFKKDLKNTKGWGDFEDLGKSKFEKNITDRNFKNRVNQANLQLPSDEKELKTLNTEPEDKNLKQLQKLGFGLNEFVDLVLQKLNKD